MRGKSDLGEVDLSFGRDVVPGVVRIADGHRRLVVYPDDDREYPLPLPYMGSIIVINFLLGWTFLGWVVGLAMAVSAVEVRATIENRPQRRSRR
jgi:hypothetical protein